MKVEENHEDSNQKCARNDSEMMRGEQKTTKEKQMKKQKPLTDCFS